MQRSFLLAFLFYASVVANAQVTSSSASSKDPANFFSRIWSPYCHGISLLECPSSQAEDLRKEIRQRMSAGETEEAIFSELNEKHPGTLRMEPSRSGRESLAYWIPWVLFAFVASFVVLFWRSRKKRLANTKRETKPAQISSNSKILEDLKARL